jgi:hypothetical protein
MLNTAQNDLFGHVPDDPVPTRRARVTNDPLSRNSQSTATGRRVADLYRSYLRAMPDRSCIGQADALRAAELTVAAEEARARLLAGSGDPNAVVRIENLAARAVRKLGLTPAAGARHVPLRERIAAARGTTARGA